MQHARQFLTEDACIIVADDEELFAGDAALVQHHPALREERFVNLLKKLYPKDYVDGVLEWHNKPSEGAGKAAEKAANKQRSKTKAKKRTKAEMAKAKLQPEYLEMARVQLKEGATGAFLAEQVQLRAKVKKVKPSLLKKLAKKKAEKQAKKTAAAKLTVKGKFWKSAKNKKKMEKQAALKKAWLESQPDFAKKPMEGMEVRIFQDFPPPSLS